MKAVVLFSGGLDSTVLVSHLLSEGAEVRLLSIDYGQRHAKELAHGEAEGGASASGDVLMTVAGADASPTSDAA